MDAEWTLDELAGRVARALAEDDVRAPNARVREVPDGRAIRWYATIGLVDRPLRYEGRSARYGQRHLLQLVAVKRRQAEGRSLAEIQAELAGASDATLRRFARLPEPAVPSPESAVPSPGPAVLSSDLAVSSPEPAVLSSDLAVSSPDPAGAVPEPESAVAGSAGAPPGSDGAQVTVGSGPRREGRFWTARSPVPGATPGVPPSPLLPVAPADPSLRYVIPLASGADLVLAVPPGPGDLAAIRATAGPLLRLLAERGLLGRPSPVLPRPVASPPPVLSPPVPPPSVPPLPPATS